MWQPIDFAPKDRTWQVVARFDGNECTWWQRARWSKDLGWKTEGGYCDPTHWFPLPVSLPNTDLPFTLEQHHELCLGVMAGCYRYVDATQKQAIREGVESARLLGFPVDTRNLEKGGPLFTGGNA
jgi:hypothetical protein